MARRGTERPRVSVGGVDAADGMDVLACPRCGGRLRLTALIEEAAVIPVGRRVAGHAAR